MARTCTLKGNPLPLTGPELKVGDACPDATVLKSFAEPLNIADTNGKTRIFSVVPSLDTSVCAMQTKRFHEEIAKLDGVMLYTVSVDLPPAQARFCGAESVSSDQHMTLSDHKDLAFGNAFGTLIPDLRILSRAVFVADPTGKLTYAEYVPEVGEHPDYDAVLAAARG